METKAQADGAMREAAAAPAAAEARNAAGVETPGAADAGTRDPARAGTHGAADGVGEGRRAIHVAAAIIMRGDAVRGGCGQSRPGSPACEIPAPVGDGYTLGETRPSPRTCEILPAEPRGSAPLASRRSAFRAREILAVQRGYGEFKDWWEFPGGKVQPGETSREACMRELREELAVELVDVVPFMTIDHDYPDFHVTMDCFTCRLAPGEHISLLEHEGMRWLGRDQLNEVAWLPADIQIIDALRAVLA